MRWARMHAGKRPPARCPRRGSTSSMPWTTPARAALRPRQVEHVPRHVPEGAVSTPQPRAAPGHRRAPGRHTAAVIAGGSMPSISTSTMRPQLGHTPPGSPAQLWASVEQRSIMAPQRRAIREQCHRAAFLSRVRGRSLQSNLPRRRIPCSAPGRGRSLPLCLRKFRGWCGGSWASCARHWRTLGPLCGLDRRDSRRRSLPLGHHVAATATAPRY